jgi:uncharacterized protein
MTRDEIIAAIRAHEEEIKAKGVTRLALFGSRVREDHRPDSDLDVLIDIDPGLPKFSLLDLAGVCGLLTDITGIETYATERRSITERFAARIADDLIEVF